MQSEAREPPTSGQESVMEGPRILLIVFIWPFIYIYIKELLIYKKESGCIPPRLGDTLLDSRGRFRKSDPI